MHIIRDVIATLRCRGVTLLAVADGKLKVEGVDLLTETEKVTLKAHKPAILQGLRQPAEAVNNCQGETVTRMPLVKEDPWAMATGVKGGWYAPNCNRCQHYRWRTATCRHQERVLMVNNPPCQGRHYQPFAPTLAERETVAGAVREGAP